MANRFDPAILPHHGSNMMPTDLAHEFANHLRDKNHLPGDSGVLNGAAPAPANRALQKLWELTDLSANDFADEVAEFFQVPRITLPELLSAQPRSEEHTSELQSLRHLVCRLLLEKKKTRPLPRTFTRT